VQQQLLQQQELASSEHAKEKTSEPSWGKEKSAQLKKR